MKRALAVLLALVPLTARAQSATPTATPAPSPSPESSPAGYGIGDLLRDTWNNSAGKIVDAVSAPVDDISEEDERALGQATALQIVSESGGLVVSDAPLVKYVNRVGNLVAQQGRRQVNGPDGKPRARSRDFVFGVLDDDDTLNAFSTPGGYVFVTSGLIRQLGSESELAWVLGHEIAHVDSEHGLTALKTYLRSRQVAVGFADATGDTNARARWQNGTFFQKAAAETASVSRTLYGKDEERAADALGLEYAVKAGYDARGASRVLDTMTNLVTPKNSLFATHDTPYQRRLALEAKMTELESRKGYAGRTGTARFTRDCIDRLDAVRAAHPAPPPAATPPR